MVSKSQFQNSLALCSSCSEYVLPLLLSISLHAIIMKIKYTNLNLGFTGYQIVNVATVILAIPVYWFFLKPATLYLQTVDVLAWRIKSQDPVETMVYELVRTVEDN